MSVSDLNKQKVRQFIEEVLNDGRLELIDELVAKDFIGRLGCVAFALNGPDGVRRFVSHRRLACPDLYMKIEDQIAEDDRVVIRWRTTAWQSQAPVATPSIGPCPHCAGITIVRLLAGKQVDAHTQCTGPGVST
jgi:predicted SnoaL-like aldol condensation-catalyzing enzyme